MRSLETLTDIFFEANPPPNVDSLHIISKHLTNRSVSVQNVQMRITVFTQISLISFYSNSARSSADLGPAGVFWGSSGFILIYLWNIKWRPGGNVWSK